MENKIQELTDKIYREGVEKANTQADSLLQEAQKKAKKIIDEASEKADSIMKDSERKSEELIENTKSELKLFADQSVNALKSEVTNLLLDEVVSDAVKTTTVNKDFLNEFMLKLAEKWSTQEDIIISTADEKALTDYFSVHAKQLLDKGVSIKQVNGLKIHFSISPKDASYKIDFGDDEFISYFKSFLRPKLIAMLFGDK